MAHSVLIVGARGRFGRAALTEFTNAGWTVSALTRDGAPLAHATGAAVHAGDATNASDLIAAAKGVDLIINAINPPYQKWAIEIPRLTNAMIAAARATGATVLLPGNVYNFGAGMPPLLSTDTPQNAQTRKGRIRRDMEAAYRTAATNGVRTILLRAGDFLERTLSGNWFDMVIAAKAARGQVTYPGQTDAPHAWAYLPDMARAAVGLAQIADQLPAFADIPFAGHTLTGEDMRRGTEAILGRKVRLGPFPWGFLKLVAPFNSTYRELTELRYLWDVPHALDPAPLSDVLPDFQMTPIHEVLADCLRNQPGVNLKAA